MKRRSEQRRRRGIEQHDLVPRVESSWTVGVVSVRAE
jgi:hypothetical protein